MTDRERDRLLHETLERWFGFSSLRPLQKEAIDAALNSGGGDAPSGDGPGGALPIDVQNWGDGPLTTDEHLEEILSEQARIAEEVLRDQGMSFAQVLKLLARQTSSSARQ